MTLPLTETSVLLLLDPMRTLPVQEEISCRELPNTIEGDDVCEAVKLAFKIPNIGNRAGGKVQCSSVL